MLISLKGVRNMSKFKTVLTLVKKPRKMIRILGDKGFFNWLPDRPYLKLVYWGETGRKLDLKNPETYNEKLQWIKLYDRKPEYVIYVDKFAVRDYIKQTIGDGYLIPLIGVYNTVDEIPWDNLPNKFVLKCTHGSGSNIICRDKQQLDIEESKRKLKRWMKKNWFWFGREWSYKDTEPRMICEKYLVDESGTELKDYKIFCFDGRPKLIQVDFGRFTDHKRNLYSTEWQFIDGIIKYPNQPSFNIKKPRKLDDMLRCASILSKNIPHVRIDFYSINEQIYFGEMTLYHGSGYEKFKPEGLGILMGSWINLAME